MNLYKVNMKVNSMRRKISHYVGVIVILPVISCLLWTGIASAEVSARGDRNDGALAKAQYLLRQISMEKEALQAENSHIKEDLKKRDIKIKVLNKKIENTKKSLSSTRNKVGKYQDAVSAQRTRMVEMRDKFQKLVDKYKELVVALRLVENERAEIQKEKLSGLRVLENCADNNQQLYQVNVELLKQYENKGVLDAILQKEPVTQLKQVEIENIVDDMKYRIDKLKVSDSITASNIH